MTSKRSWHGRGKVHGGRHPVSVGEAFLVSSPTFARLTCNCRPSIRVIDTTEWVSEVGGRGQAVRPRGRSVGRGQCGLARLPAGRRANSRSTHPGHYRDGQENSTLLIVIIISLAFICSNICSFASRRARNWSIVPRQNKQRDTPRPLAFKLVILDIR